MQIQQRGNSSQISAAKLYSRGEVQQTSQVLDFIFLLVSCFSTRPVDFLRKPKGWLPAFESDELFARSFPFWLKNSLNDGMVGSSTFPAEAAIVFADSSELFVFSNSWTMVSPGLAQTSVGAGDDSGTMSGELDTLWSVAWSMRVWKRSCIWLDVADDSHRTVAAICEL